jgi:hypothetical protein
MRTSSNTNKTNARWVRKAVEGRLPGHVLLLPYEEDDVDLPDVCGVRARGLRVSYEI